MIFKNSISETLKQGIAELRYEGLSVDSNNREMMRDFYFDRQIAEKYYKNYGFKDKKIPNSAFNLTRTVIDKVSLIYKYPPERTLDNDPIIEIDEETGEEEEVEDLYSAWLQANPRCNISLKNGERMKNLHDVVLWRPWVDSKSKRWKYYIETEYVPHFIDGDPLYPIAYSIKVKQNAESDKIDQVHDDWWVFWSDEDYFFHNNDGEKKSHDEMYGDGQFKDMKNPYGIIPYVELRKDEPIDSYRGEGAITLVSANHNINIAMMDIFYAIHFQAFNQPWLSGVDQTQADELKVGADKIWGLPEGAAAGMLNYSPNLAEAMQTVKDAITLIAKTYNLNLNVSVEGGNPASGFSLLVQNIDLLEARQDDIDIAKAQEKEIYEVLSRVQNYHVTAGHIQEPKLPLDVAPIVNFKDIDFPINQGEEIERWKSKIEFNVATPVDWIMAENNEADREKAEEQYLINKKLNGKLTKLEEMKEKATAFGAEIIEEEEE